MIQPRSAPLLALLAAALPLTTACTGGPGSGAETGSQTSATGPATPVEAEAAVAQEPARQDPEPTLDDVTETAPTPKDPMTDPQPTDEPTLEVATLGAGCFWCIEAVLEQVDGVQSVVSGYMGGETENPTYREVCTGRTGHAEVVQVTFDPAVIAYKDVLDWFWRSHDPTTLNRQGNDIGTQYRSAIFTHSDEQARIAATSREDVAPSFSDPIVTEITPASTFYPAEDYHQGYYFENTTQGYCRAVIAPKLKKLGLKY